MAQRFHCSFIASIASAGRAVHYAQVPLVHVNGGGLVAAVGVKPGRECMHMHVIINF